MNLEKSNTLTSVYFLSKPSLKIGTANTICWNYLGLFRDYGLDHICFRNKTFCFSGWKTEIFSICLKQNFVKPHKISTQSDNRCKPPVPLVGQKTRSLHEILTRMVITEKSFADVFSNNHPCQYFM